MDINQLTKIVKKKISDNIKVENINVEDKTFLHKRHKSHTDNKFHLKITIFSEELKLKNKIESTKIVYKLLEYEINKFIHSLQIFII